MDNKHMEKCSALLVAGKIQNKATRIYTAYPTE